MLSLRTSASIQLVVDVHPDPALRSLLALRMAQLAPTDGVDLGDAAHFLIFEPGDRLYQLEAELGFSPLEREPSWEWVEAHRGWFELAYIFSDDGDGALLFVSRAEGVDTELLALCNRWAAD